MYSFIRNVSNYTIRNFSIFLIIINKKIDWYILINISLSFWGFFSKIILIIFYWLSIILNLIKEVIKHTIIFLAIGQNFCYTITKIVSRLATLIKTTKNSVLVILFGDIGTIKSWLMSDTLKLSKYIG